MTSAAATGNFIVLSFQHTTSTLSYYLYTQKMYKKLNVKNVWIFINLQEILKLIKTEEKKKQKWLN